MSDVLPPPPPPRGDGGCWKWGGISCGIGCIGLVVLGVVFWSTVGRKAFDAVMQGQQQAIVCQREMQTVWQALERYHADKGKYPERLAALVPKYLPDKSQLHYSAEPQGPEFTYFRPDVGASAASPVLEYSITLPLPNMPPIVVRVTKDGRTETLQSGTPYGRGRDLP